MERPCEGTRNGVLGAKVDRAVRVRLALGATVVALLLVPTTASRASEPAANGPKGAMTCDFEVSLDAPLDQIAGLLERDRIYMTREPGMLHKHVPIRPDPVTGSLLAGGRYLFDTADYLRWARTQFVLDGTHFFDRYYFHDVDCHSWSVIGATDFGDIHTSQVVLRTERWSVPTSNQRPLLQEHWPSIQADGNARGLPSVWLLYNRQENLASLVYFADRAAPGGPAETLDPAGLAALETAPPLGAPFDMAPMIPPLEPGPSKRRGLERPRANVDNFYYAPLRRRRESWKDA